MSWRTISTAQFLAEAFNASERASVQAAAGGDDGLSDILDSHVASWRGLIEAAGNTVSTTAGTVPDSIRLYLLAQARWALLLKFPQLKSLQTDAREKAAERAEEIIDKIAAGDFPIESGGEDDTTDNGPGNWNANPKIAMRSDGTERANE